MTERCENSNPLSIAHLQIANVRQSGGGAALQKLQTAKSEKLRQTITFSNTRLHNIHL
jgi:hypothetical protein